MTSRRPSHRRRFVVRLLLTLVALVVAGAGVVVGLVALTYRGARVDTVGTVAFDRPLRIPPLAPSHLDDQGRRVFSLRMQSGTSDFGHGATPTWGFDGAYLGPTLRATRGETVVVDVHNSLPEASTVHWHGMHLPAAMDGGPHQMVAPGASWSPSWTIDQPAATLWYHPHPHGATADQVYRGLAGMFLVDDPATGTSTADTPTVPHTYGVNDVPVIVQDKNFDGEELDESGAPLSDLGVLGDTVLVDGTPNPYLDVTTTRVRLRLLNASNARAYLFAFDDHRRFDLVGTDGGLLPAPLGTDRLLLSPGERAEVVVTVAPGERPVLRSEAPGDLGGGRLRGGDDRFDVLQLRAAATLRPSPALPATLAPAPDLRATDVVAERTFDLDATSINDQNMDMNRIDFGVRVDTVERWRVRNSDGHPHSFHVHDVQYAVESVDGAPPPPALRGWKDTVFVQAGTEVSLLLRFTDYTDPDVPYMYHCHLLRHEDNGMMGQFVVLAPGEQIGRPPAGSMAGMP